MSSGTFDNRSTVKWPAFNKSEISDFEIKDYIQKIKSISTDILFTIYLRQDHYELLPLLIKIYNYKLKKINTNINISIAKLIKSYYNIIVY